VTRRYFPSNACPSTPTERLRGDGAIAYVHLTAATSAVASPSRGELADGTGTEILTWLDDHSRLALRVTAWNRVTGLTCVKAAPSSKE